MTLPADYAIEHVELGYAQTSHTSQGRTVDTALLLIDNPTDHAGIYTPMTRGRHANHAYIAIDENQNAADVLAYAVTQEWADQPAVARRAGLERDPKRTFSIPEQTLESSWGLEQGRHGRNRQRGSIGVEL